MRHPAIRGFATTFAVILVLSIVAPGAGAYTRPVKITRLNLDRDGRPVDEPTQTTAERTASVDDRGRFVAFDTVAALVPEDLNGMSDIYLRNTTTGKLSLITRGVDGTPSAGPPLAFPVGAGTSDLLDLSLDAQISGNGRYIVFVSSASNLVNNDANLSGAGDIFVHDRISRTTELASVDSKENQSLTAGSSFTPDSFVPSISDNGKVVAFGSRADGLVPGDTNGVSDIFIRDLTAGTTQRVSLDSSGQESDGCAVGLGRVAGCKDYGVFHSSISGDGRHVVFEGWASDFIENDLNNAPDVFIHDLQTTKTRIVSVASDGSQGEDQTSPPTDQQAGSRLTCCGSSPRSGGNVVHSVSDDGRFVLFQSAANNLVPSDTNAREDIVWDTSMDYFVHDTGSGRTDRVTIDSFGGQGVRAGVSDTPSISGNGRFVTYSDKRQNHPDQASEGNGSNQSIYVHDRLTGATTLTSLAGGGGTDVSDDGRFVTFWSRDPDVTSNADTNGQWDLFMADRGAPLWSQVGARVLRGGSAESTSGPLLAAGADHDVNPGPSLADADITSAVAVEREQTSDLLLRLDLQRLSLLRANTSLSAGDLGAPLLAYGFEIETTDGEHLQIQVSASATGQPSFELYRCTSGDCVKTADLTGAFGTTGESILVSLPMSAFQTSPPNFSRVTAFSYEKGGLWATRILDSLDLISQ